MADGTIQTAGDKISTDELVTLNGAAVPAGGEKVQRFKVGFGSDSVLRDVDAANPLPVTAATPSATYSACINGLAIALLATDVFVLSGSATKTVRINKVTFDAIQTTASQVSILLVKRSTADTAGTSTAPAVVSYDTNNAAATAIALGYTANPTLGTAVGNAYTERVFVPGAATASDARGLAVTFGDVGQQFLTLRGVAQQLAINLAGVTLAGGSANITIEWTES